MKTRKTKDTCKHHYIIGGGNYTQEGWERLSPRCSKKIDIFNSHSKIDTQVFRMSSEGCPENCPYEEEKAGVEVE